MRKFRKRSIVITAQQYHNVPNGWPEGVCAGCDEVGLSIGPHVHTVFNDEIVELDEGDWVIPEADGVHYYSMKSDVFMDKYEPIDD